MAASIVPVSKQNVRSEAKQRIGSRLMADSSSESGGDQFLRYNRNWSDRPREIVDYAAARCNLLQIACPRTKTGLPAWDGFLGLETLIVNNLRTITVHKIFV